LAVGFWQNTGEIARKCSTDKIYEPKMSAEQREQLYKDWKRAVERSRNWATK
jgi:glycerol kinase